METSLEVRSARVPSQNNFQARNCVVCGSDKKQSVYPAKLPYHIDSQTLHYNYDDTKVQVNSWHYEIVKCLGCGHRYSGAILQEDAIINSYLEQNHDNEFGLSEDVLMKTVNNYVKTAAPHLPPGRDLQLDIGCDTGLFLKATRHLGFKRSVGIEPGFDSAKKASLISGVEIQQKAFDPQDFSANSVDFASLIHVLDHLADSRRLIHNLSKIMRKEGLVFAVVHNIDSLLSKVSGKSWAPLNLVHFEYFNKITLAKLFENEGFRVIDVVGTANVFPLSHLIRYAPFVPNGVRKPLMAVSKIPPLSYVNLSLQLGNIGVLAKKI